jgi:hypothetical protein
MASLKKFVAIWMHIAPAKVQKASQGFHVPCNFHDNTHPAHTGTMAAGKVFGRAARSQFFMGIGKSYVLYLQAQRSCFSITAPAGTW